MKKSFYILHFFLNFFNFFWILCRFGYKAGGIRAEMKKIYGLICRGYSYT